MKYYRIFDDLYDREAWVLNVPHLSDGSLANRALYASGNKILNPEYLKTSPMEPHPGGSNKHKDFAVGGPYVSEKFANVILQLANDDIQLIPLEVEGEDGKFYILNILRHLDCIDYERTKFDISIVPSDPLFGKPRGIISLKVDPKKAHGYHIFRVKDWFAYIIVSEEMKNLIESHGFKGMTFTEL